MSACGSGDGNKAGDSDAIRLAVERRVIDTTTTEPTRSGPELTAEQIALIYRDNGPAPAVSGGDIREGDIITFETACDLLIEAVDYDQMLLVYETFGTWFRNQLIVIGATTEYIDSWDTDGMLDDLIELGCSPSASPAAVELR